MELTLVAVGGVAVAVTIASFSRRLGIAAPLLLVVFGAALSFVPGVPRVDIDPEWILTVVLPPLIYSAAINMPTQDLRRDIKAIGGLAVVLVVATTVGAGWVCHMLVPEIGWPAAFALGAVISPTDAVAATSVGRKLGLPSRLLSVLEGEGLINDAAALTLLKSASAAIAASVSLWHVVGSFVYSVVVAIVIGAVAGYLTVRVRAVLHDSVLNTAVSFVVPFVAFIPAEDLGASGILATVVAGLVTGHLGVKYLDAQARVSQTLNWRTLSFLLESFVFLYMGLSLKHLIDDVHPGALDLWNTIGIGLIMSVTVIVIRIVFVAPLVGVMHRDAQQAEEHKPRLQEWQKRLSDNDFVSRFTPRRIAHIERRVERASGDIEYLLNQRVGWRGGVVLGWAGMRGAITVAAANTLPADTPYRAQLLLVAFVVAAFTLLVQGGTLPLVIKAIKVPSDDPVKLRSDYESLITTVSSAGRDVINEAADRGQVSVAVIDRVRSDSRIAEEQSEAEGEGEAQRQAVDIDQFREYRQLRLQVIDAERDALIKARDSGAYSSQAVSNAQRQLDVQESAIRLVAQEE
ncbi:sodium:proton antiporter [Gordonia jinhuaensis]|uniref:Peptidase n=1 Tax=Gordonia jinhuaensis TaxID=1517702 RepID=A0A916T9S9_9ACTN|nr:sodium:proton antiporter [Gordonia jinhuaensis]GGB37143.1 peptidase [Gordonia jinhuaensis]